MSPTIPLPHLYHTLECRHSFLRDPLQPMEADIFFPLVFKDLVNFMSDVIKYHCPLYTGI